MKTGVVKQGGSEALNDADLGAETQGEKHQEEQSGPDINIEQFRYFYIDKIGVWF